MFFKYPLLTLLYFNPIQMVQFTTISYNGFYLKSNYDLISFNLVNMM